MQTSFRSCFVYRALACLTELLVHKDCTLHVWLASRNLLCNKIKQNTNRYFT